jgi:hypothetical protein
VVRCSSSLSAWMGIDRLAAIATQAAMGTTA